MVSGISYRVGDIEDLGASVAMGMSFIAIHWLSRGTNTASRLIIHKFSLRLRDPSMHG